jgi:heat shock protein HslJ
MLTARWVQTMTRLLLVLGTVSGGSFTSVARSDEPAPAVAAAAPADAPADETKLTGDWKLVKLGDEAVPADADITLSVTAEGKLAGSTGVNRFFGGFDDTGKKLFGPLGMTRRAGPPDETARETAFTKALDEVTRFTIEKDQLTLLAGDKPRLVFSRVKPKAEE